MSRKTIVILHNVRSAYNVGSIFRTADAAGVSELFLTGYTPAPVDRFGRANAGIAKSALGAEHAVFWEKRTSPATLIVKLQKSKVFVVAVEQSKDARDYKKIRMRYPAAFLFGNEVRGLSSALLGKCDAVAEIPMRGKKESLNVSVAAGIMLFHAP